MVRYQEFRPLSALKDYVRDIYFLDHENDYQHTSYQRVTPDGCFELNFHLYDDALMKASGNFEKEQLPPVYLVNRSSAHYFLKRTNFVRVVGIRFYPWGLHPFVDIKIPEIIDQSLEAEIIWGGKLKGLREKIFSFKDCRDVVTYIEMVLMRYLYRTKREDKLIMNIARHIYDQRGSMQDIDLFKLSDLSVRRLQQRFKSVTGVSVTNYRRLIRFQDILFQMNCMKKPAPAAGYYDQSHFVRDFKAFAGITPAAYKKEMHPLNDFTAGRF